MNEPNTVRAVLAQWQNSVRFANLSPRTVQHYVHNIRPLYDALKDAPLKDEKGRDNIKRANLRAIRDQIARKRGHGAALQFVRACSAFFNWCREEEIIETNPTYRLEKDLQKGTIPTWTEEQVAKALAELPEHLRRVVRLALETAQRRGDLCAMRWSDFDGTTIRIRQEKTGAALEIPLSPDFCQELLAWKREARSLFILTTEAGTPWKPIQLSQYLARELQAIGLPPGLNVHGLRKCAATRLAQAQCTPHEIMAVTGHRTLAMVELYTAKVNQRTLAEDALRKRNERALWISQNLPAISSQKSNFRKDG